MLDKAETLLLAFDCPDKMVELATLAFRSFVPASLAKETSALPSTESFYENFYY